VYLLDIEPVDLGPDVKAVGLELVEADETREPVRGNDAARIWARALAAAAGSEPWALDFFSHLDRVKDFCERRQIAFRQASQRSIVIPAPPIPALEALVDRFLRETFGARAGGAVATGDPALEADLAKRGVDAYHIAYPNYYFCAVCGLEDGSLTLLSQKLWASEVIRRVRPSLRDLDGIEVEVRLPS
jgi:hypothetical protein